MSDRGGPEKVVDAAADASRVTEGDAGIDLERRTLCNEVVETQPYVRDAPDDAHPEVPSLMGSIGRSRVSQERRPGGDTEGEDG